MLSRNVHHEAGFSASGAREGSGAPNTATAGGGNHALTASSKRTGESSQMITNNSKTFNLFDAY